MIRSKHFPRWCLLAALAVASLSGCGITVKLYDARPQAVPSPALMHWNASSANRIRWDNVGSTDKVVTIKGNWPFSNPAPPDQKFSLAKGMKSPWFNIPKGTGTATTTTYYHVDPSMGGGPGEPEISVGP